MDTLNKYKKDIRKMFFVSIDNDLDKWLIYGDNFSSPYYNNTRLIVNCDIGFKLYICLGEVGSEKIKIKKYKFIFIPLDFKVYKYVRILKKHFKKIEKDKENAKIINDLSFGLENIQKNYIKALPEGLILSEDGKIKGLNENKLPDFQFTPPPPPPPDPPQSEE